MSEPSQSLARHPQMTAYLERARWFGGKGRGHEVTHVDRIASVESGERLFTLDLLTVEYAGDTGGRDTERYQMPLVHLREEQADLAHALLGRHDGRWTYDAVHDADSMERLLRTFLKAGADGTVGTVQVGGAVFHRLATTRDEDLDPVASPPRVLTGEQSNTSVVYGRRTLLKLFRKITPGRNPDIEVHDALTRAGNTTVGALRGWVSAGEGQHETDLAMLQEFLPDAHDGWALVLDAAREDREVLTEVRSLGEAVASAHRSLAEEFPTTAVSGAELAERMQVRLEAALVGLPQLAPYADGLRAALDGVGELGDQPAQRVHGDLHLGQTLLTDDGWRIVDFEGEPARPLAERRLPDSPWRDVAGMLRSLDYAARSVVLLDGVEPARADAWLAAHRRAFLEGYGDPQGAALLLDAYEADKAVYEVGYEARNRPDWVEIPVAAIDRIANGARA